MDNSEKAKLDKLKKTEVEILRETISICQKLNLTYYVLEGTLLGAVRHKGFIPWDDDVDIGMPRPDYNVFLKEAPKYLSKHLFLQTHETDPGYLHAYAKVRNSDTTFIEKLCKDADMNHGIFIDVFPLDFWHKQNSLIYRTRKEALNERIMTDFFPNRYRSPIGKLATLWSKLRYPSVETAFQKREKLYRSVKDGAYLANHNSPWGEREIIPVQWYAEGTVVEFEGLQVLAPKEYDKWLTQVYGDYMQLPPVEKQVTHHESEVIDPDHSYRNYLNR